MGIDDTIETLGSNVGIDPVLVGEDAIEVGFIVGLIEVEKVGVKLGAPFLLELLQDVPLIDLSVFLLLLAFFEEWLC